MLRRAIEFVQRTLREYISKDDKANVYVYTKILSHLVNSWAEVRVLKLVYESVAFSDSERADIISCRTVREKWERALDIAFCNVFKISRKNINSVRAPKMARLQRDVLLGIIRTDLLEWNQLRNRIAHGQWKYGFNDDLLGVNGQLTSKLRKENIVKLQLKLAMFKSLAQIIHDLAVSERAFKRDFDANYKKLEEQKRNFHNREYQDYKEKLIQKRERGLKRRRNNL